jgi:hypothetical protein
VSRIELIEDESKVARADEGKVDLRPASMSLDDLANEVAPNSAVTGPASPPSTCRVCSSGSTAVAEKLTEGTKIDYELQIKGAAVTSVAFMPDGKLVPREAPEKKS